MLQRFLESWDIFHWLEITKVHMYQQVIGTISEIEFLRREWDGKKTMNDQKSYSSFYKVLRNIHYKEIAGSSISFPVGGATSSTYGWNDKEQHRFIKWMSLAWLFSLGQRILPLGGFLQWLRDVPWDSRASNQIALRQQQDKNMTDVSKL